MKEVKEDNAQEESTEDKSAEMEEEEIKPPADESEGIRELYEEVARMQQELEEVKLQSEAATDTMLRLAAELDNYKKRTAKERKSLIKYASQDIVQELLPILDNFQRAIQSASESRDFNSFLEGVKMVSKQMHDVLKKKGVSTIEAVGKTFDPTVHEAVMQITSEDHPENVVVAELQKGYMLHDRVIRPSMVAVSKGAKEE